MGGVMESIIRINERDLCIGISFPRYSTGTIEALRLAKEKGASVIAITDSASAPIAEIADEALIARSDMVSFADSLVAPLSLINAIVVASSIRRKNEVFARFNQLEKIWDDERVYATHGSEKNE